MFTTNSHSYLLYSSSHPSHVKNSIPFSQFLRLRRLCSNDSDFSVCASFSINVAILFLSFKRAEKENTDCIPFTLTFHPHNHAVKSIILKNFKLLQNDSETGTIFSQPPLISFKRDKNIGNFLVRSSFQTSDQSGTFKCARSRCKTCSFTHTSHNSSNRSNERLTLETSAF